MKFRGRLGPEKGDDKSIRLLSRVIEWKEEGISYEADQRHADIIVREMGLNKGGKTVITPGIKEDAKEDDEKELRGEHATKYRALVARGLYLTQDRSDIQYTIKELSRIRSWTPCIRPQKLSAVKGSSETLKTDDFNRKNVTI